MDSTCGLRKVVQIVAFLQLLFAGGTEGTTATEGVQAPVVPRTTPRPYSEKKSLRLDVRRRLAEDRLNQYNSFFGCRLPPAPRNGFAIVRRNTNRVVFHCNRGFNITSTKSMTCYGRLWNRTPPRCLNGTAVTCPPLTPPEHGYIVGECVTTYPGKCVFECDGGFELTAQGSEIRTCQVNGTWSGVTSQCVVKRCGEPPTPVNGYVRDCQEDRAVGTSCTICCFEGYRLVGESTTVCTSSKTWTVAEPICNLVQCPSPASLTRTARFLEHGLNRTYVYKDTFWPRCLSGFRLRGPHLILCGANGQWEAVLEQSTLFNCVGE
ncbi:unnamed protein product [Ixodes pacificus]